MKMKRYTIGLITGILLTASAFMFMGAQNKNLGDIKVKSITIEKNGKETVFIGDGFMRTSNANGKQTAYLGTGKEGIGFMRTNNADGKETAYLGTGEGGIGFMKTNNADGKLTVYLGTNTDKDGMIIVSDRYGDIGWSVDGKK